MTRYALLIGINKYDDEKNFKELGAPVDEAKKFGELLEKYGDFKIIRPPCKDFNGLREEIHDFCTNKKQEDILLFYFSGHGKHWGKWEHNKKFYFITKETNYLNLKLKSISAQFVIESLEDSRTKAQIVILDACHSGGYGKGGEDDIESDINEELNAAKGLFFLASCQSYETSFENSDEPLEKRKSFFTEILIEGIEEGKADTGTKGIITFSMLKNYIYENIKNQTPEGKIESGGSLELVRNPKSSASGKLNCLDKEEFEEKIKYENQVNYAKKCIKKGDYENAIQELNEARLNCMKKKNFNSNLIEEIDDILKDLKDKRNGDKIFQDSPEKTKPDDYDQKNYKEDIRCYEKALETDPNNTFVMNNLGLAHYDQKNYQEAIHYYKKTLEIDSNYFLAWYNLGLVHRAQNKNQEAIRCYKKSLEIDPNYATTWSALGTVHQIQKNYQEAIRCYKKALEIDPNNVFSLTGLGGIHRDQKNYQEAIRCFKKSLETDSNYAKSWYNLGCVHYDQKNYQEAIRCYKRTLEIDPNHVYARAALRMVYKSN